MQLGTMQLITTCLTLHREEMGTAKYLSLLLEINSMGITLHDIEKTK